ncbi:MAG: amidohydrolase family protein [Dehalococcoidia bacterium]
MGHRMIPFLDIPLVDDHVHPPFADPSGRLLASFFTEAGDEESVERHVPHSLFYRRALRELGLILQCEPDEASVRAARNAHTPGEYLRLLTKDANIETLLVDEGYPPRGTLSLEEMAGFSGCQTRRIIRLETLAESLFNTVDSPKALGAAIIEHLMRAPAFVALKTIVAYRSGLDVVEPPMAAAAAAFAQVQAHTDGQPPRLTAKALLDYLLLRALDWAAERGVPVQFHTGYGDRDLDVRLANPAHLRPILEQPRYARLKIVLLHSSYPYCREASYLASVYPNVYVDWSEANPMLPPRQLQRVLEELLALAPYTKLLYGSDAWGAADWLWLGAKAGRTALAMALQDEPDRETIAWRILHDNARELYSL